MPRVEALRAAPQKTFGEWLRAHPEVRALAFDDHALPTYFYAQRRIERFGGRDEGRFRAAFEAGGPAAAVVRKKRQRALAGLDRVALGEDERHVFVANAAGRAHGEPRAAALRLASAEASIEIDPERFGLRLRDAAGRVVAEKPPSDSRSIATVGSARAPRARRGPARIRTRARAAGGDGRRRGRGAASLAHAACARRRVRPAGSRRGHTFRRQPGASRRARRSMA